MHSKNDAATESPWFSEIFDCNKLRLLLQKKETASLGEKINKWMNNWVAHGRIVIAKDQHDHY